MQPPQVEWTWGYPHTAKVAARGGGAWCLNIRPDERLTGCAWHVAHSSGCGGSRTGSTTGVKIAMFQAERAAAELEAAASPVVGPAMDQTRHDPNHL